MVKRHVQHIESACSVGEQQYWQRFIAGDTLGKGRCGGMPHTILIRHVLLNVVCGWDDLQHMVRRSDYLFDAL